jgi:hypothetical protein
MGSKDLDQIFLTGTWTWTPPAQGKFSTWWDACFDPMVKQQLLNPQESVTAIPFSDKFSEALQEWDKGDHTQQLAGSIVGKFRALMDKLPGRQEFYSRTRGNQGFQDLYEEFIGRSRSVVEAILTTVESNFRKEPYELTLAKLEVARIADLDGRPSSSLYWLDPGETPASYWSGKAGFVPPGLQKINQALTENLKALEDPARFDQRPLAEQIQILKDLGENYTQLRSGLRRPVPGIGNLSALAPVLAGAMRGLVAPAGGWQLAQPGAGQPGRAGMYSGPILSLTRAPDVSTLPPAVKADYQKRSQALTARRQRQNEELRKKVIV